MHMLHTRRKAEIEILSTAKLVQPRRIFHHARDMDIDTDTDMDKIAQQTSPLLEYLLDKISAFIDAYASNSHNT